MTIIFITIYPFNEDYAKKYGFDILEKRGIHVVIFNVFNILFPKSVEDLCEYSKLSPVSGKEQIRIKSKKELEDRLSAIKGRRIVALVVYPYVKLLRILHRANIDYIRFYLSSTPKIVKKTPTIFNRILVAIILLLKRPKQFISTHPNLLIRFVPYSSLKIRHPKLVFIGADILSCEHPTYKTRVEFTHTFDYDRYLRNLNKPKPMNIPDYEYYVHLSNHPWGVHDSILLNTETVITKEEYAQKINSFHDFIEKETGKRIIISAYPKAAEDENIYNGRPFLHVDTEQLVKYSSGVICHFTGAINFAVIHNKPICITSIGKLDNDPLFSYYVQAYATALHSEIHYIDTEENMRGMLHGGMFCYDADVYRAFREKFLRSSEDDGRPIWDMVADVLQEHYN